MKLHVCMLLVKQAIYSSCVLYIYHHVFYTKVKELENVEYIEEETMVRGTGATASWALDRIDQISSTGDDAYDPGTGRDGSGVDIYIFDSG